MKATVDKMQIGLTLAIALIGGAAYKYSALESRVYFQEMNQAAIRSDFGTKLDQILAMRTDIEVIKVKVQAMEKPVYHTHLDVQTLRKEVAQLSVGPFSAFHGPLTMSGQN